MAVALAAAILAAVGISSRDSPIREKPQIIPASQISVKARQSVAVLGIQKPRGTRRRELALERTSGDVEHQELAAGAGPRMISGEDVAKTTADLALAKMPSYRKKHEVEKLHGILNSDYVVAGSYVAAGNNKVGSLFRLDVRLQNAEVRRNRLFVWQRRESSARCRTILKRIGGAIRSGFLGIQIPSEIRDRLRRRQPGPLIPRQYGSYSEGLAKLRTLDALGRPEIRSNARSRWNQTWPLRTALGKRVADSWIRLERARRSEESRQAFRRIFGMIDRRSIESKIS